MNSPFLCFLWSDGQKSHIRLGYERQVGKQQSLITITFVVAEHVADIWRERACTLSVEVSQRFHLSRIRPLPLSEAKVGVITNWSQSGLQSPTEINAPRGCAEICIEQRVAQQLFARWCAQALACIFICAPVASCTECFCIIGNSKEFPII